MIQPGFSPALQELIDYLDALTERAGVQELGDVLRRLDLTIEDVEPWVRYCDDGYQRNLIRSGPMYQAFALCWKSGQRSSIHDHAHSTCGVKVLTGTATETIFKPTPCGLICPTTTHQMHTGEVCVSQDSDIHQISNYEAEGTGLVTLHIYTPALEWVNTYSLTSPEVARLECPVNIYQP